MWINNIIILVTKLSFSNSIRTIGCWFISVNKSGPLHSWKFDTFEHISSSFPFFKFLFEQELAGAEETVSGSYSSLLENCIQALNLRSCLTYPSELAICILSPLNLSSCHIQPLKLTWLSHPGSNFTSIWEFSWDNIASSRV